jgi:preprotein translocase subunit YajC
MLISSAFAADPTAAAQNPLMGFLFPVVLLVAFFLLVWRPQMKKSKDQKAMQDALGKGDEVIVISGQLGKIVKISEQYVTLDIGGGTETIFQRTAIQTVLPKGTIKDI